MCICIVVYIFSAINMLYNELIANPSPPPPLAYPQRCGTSPVGAGRLGFGLGLREIVPHADSSCKGSKPRAAFQARLQTSHDASFSLTGISVVQQEQWHFKIHTVGGGQGGGR